MKQIPQSVLDLALKGVTASNLLNSDNAMPSGWNVVMENGGKDTGYTFFKLYSAGNDMIMSAKGATEPSDFKIVLRMNKSPFLDGYVHEGCFNSAKWIVEQIKDKVAECKGRIICTGHSLGGATATLVALLLRETNNMENVSCVTFASLPSVSRDISKRMAGYTTTFVFRNDIVPRLNTKNIGTLVSQMAPPGPQYVQRLASLENMILTMVQGILRQHGNNDEAQMAKVQGELIPVLENILRTSNPNETQELVISGDKFHLTPVGEEQRIVVNEYDDKADLGNMMMLMFGAADHPFERYSQIINSLDNLD